MMPDLQTPAASPPLNARCRLPCADCPAFSHSLFADLPNESREKIDRFKITLRYEKGQNIHKEGNPSYGIHCIGSGIVKVYKTTGKQYIVRLAGRGSVLGLPTLVTGIPYLWTAEAVQSSTICFIPREVLLENIGKNPAMAIRIINILSHFLVESEQQRIELVRGTVRQRIARFLLFLSKNHGVREREGIAIRAGLTRRDMADTVGAAEGTFIRILKEFRERGILKIRQREIIVTDPERVAQLASGPESPDA